MGSAVSTLTGKKKTQKKSASRTVFIDPTISTDGSSKLLNDEKFHSARLEMKPQYKVFGHRRTFSQTYEEEGIAEKVFDSVNRSRSSNNTNGVVTGSNQEMSNALCIAFGAASKAVSFDLQLHVLSRL